MNTPVLAFVSLFLGLVVGPHPVEVAVSAPVAKLELYLDGETIGSLQSPPWRFECDFGADPEPHRLEAVAYDGDETEIARVEQWINLPSQPVEASVVIERPGGDRAFAVLTWAHRLDVPLAEVFLEFDGRLVDVDDSTRIPLPPHDPAQLHFLRAELEFADGLSTVAEVVFGGSYSDQVSADLTALPVVLAKGAETPAVNRMEGWFESDAPVRVAAVDKGPAEIVIIRDQAAQEFLGELGGMRHAPSANVGYSHDAAGNRFAHSLKKDQNLGFFWPFIDRVGEQSQTFPATHGWYSARDGGVGWYLANIRPPQVEPSEQLLADAVAVAGMNALARGRRRAVVLILSGAPADSSLLTPAQVRSYLSNIRVPLFVWSPVEMESDSPWGTVVDISSRGSFRRAVDDLAEAVDRQRIVWFEGRHLPQRITLRGEATGVTFPR